MYIVIINKFYALLYFYISYRYCAKLPSDAFTYLTPKCAVEQTDFNNHLYYVASLKLPINSPVKKEVKVCRNDFDFILH